MHYVQKWKLIGHTCYKFGVPFIITRSLSDVYGHGESSMQFDEYLNASENLQANYVELVVLLRRVFMKKDKI